MKLEMCPGCKGKFPIIDGPVHPYIESMPGCWAVYGEILSKEYGEYGYPEIHRLTVDAYAVQHPGKPSRQSIQSVWIHLIALYVALEKKIPLSEITKIMKQVLEKEPLFDWIKPPEKIGGMTVLDVVEARNLEEHTKLVTDWANSVWESWSADDSMVRKLESLCFMY